MPSGEASLLAGLIHKALEQNPRAKIVGQLQKAVRDEASLDEADDICRFGFSREELKVAQENDHDCWELMNFLRKEAGLKHEQVSQHDQVRLRAAVGGHRTTKLQLSPEDGLLEHCSVLGAEGIKAVPVLPGGGWLEEESLSGCSSFASFRTFVCRQDLQPPQKAALEAKDVG